MIRFGGRFVRGFGLGESDPTAFQRFEQAITHPFDTAVNAASNQAREVGRGAGTIISSGAEGGVEGLEHPLGPEGKPVSATWPYWVGGALLVAVGTYVVVVRPFVKEIIDTRRENRRLKKDCPVQKTSSDK